MISTFGSPPALRTSHAASTIARTCIAYRPGLHDPEPHAAQPEHRVRLVQLSHLREHAAPARRRPRRAPRPSATSTDELGQVGQELVQRRVEQPHGHRQPVHRAEDPDEVAALQRQQHVVGGLLLLGGLREDHLLHGRHALLARGTCARSGTGRSPRRRARARSSTGRACRRSRAPAAGGGRRRAPSAARTPARSAARGLRVARPRLLQHRLRQRQLPHEHVAGEAVDRDRVALAHGGAVRA